MEGGVTIDQRAKDGCSDRQFKFIWPREVVQLKHKTEEDCWNLMFPVDWFLAQEGPLGWTNASLPANVDRFSEFHVWQSFMGGLFYHQAALGTCGRKKPLGFCKQWMLEEGLGW